MTHPHAPLEFNEVERAILEWCATHADCPELRAQLRAARPAARRMTGVGSYTDLSIPATLARIPASALERGSHGPIYGPDLSATELEHGACSQIYIDDGAAAFLEIAAYGAEFPARLTNLQLWPAGGMPGADPEREHSRV
jgi:hypothetical protein